MADNDQFTFDDDDGFPETTLGKAKQPEQSGLSDDEVFSETDLSAAFADGEHSAAMPEEDPPDANAKSAGNSRTKLLLIILLLVVAGGGGAYFILGLDGSSPSVPTVAVPAKPVAKVVAVPPKPAQNAAAPGNAEPGKQTVTVSVPVPPAPVQQGSPAPATAVVPDSKPAAPVQPAPVAVATPAAPAPTNQPVAVAPPPAPVEAPVAQVAAPAPVVKPAPAPPSAATPIAKPQPTEVSAVAAKPAATALNAERGEFVLDAGSYLLDANRDTLVAKIKKLGYEPLITPVEATLDMTRLRIGTYSKEDVQEALTLARSVEPGSYSSPAGDRYVIYAGTFLQAESIDDLSKKFLKEGIKVYSEPVQVVRTLSRIRFGNFASKAEALDAARVVSAAGLKTDVVKFR